MSRKQGRSLSRIIGGWLLFIFILLVLIFAAQHIWKQKTAVMDNSMSPTLSAGEEVLVNKYQYLLASPARYDIIVFPHRYQDGILDIKRVIALPGETVQIMDGQIYVNGALQVDPYGGTSSWQAGVASSMITLDENEYFVLGDNRSVISDSRDPSIGCIRREEIQGKVLAVLLPLRQMRFIG